MNDYIEDDYVDDDNIGDDYRTVDYMGEQFIVTEEEFEKIQEEVRYGMIEYASMPEGESKKIKYAELYVLLITAREYYCKNFRRHSTPKEEYMDQFQDMIERALRCFNPEKGDFWNYFNNGFKKIRDKEAPNKAKEKEYREMTMISDDEFYDGDTNHTAKESDVGGYLSSEEEYFKAAGKADKKKIVAQIFLNVANKMITTKESISSSKTNTNRYRSAFYTGDIVALLKNAYEKEYGIEAEEAVEILKRDEVRNLRTLDMDLIEYTYVIKPLDIESISVNELKKYKDIVGTDCNKPEEVIRVPFEAKYVYLNYFKNVHSFPKISEQTISNQRKNYEKLLGEYSLEE